MVYYKISIFDDTAQLGDYSLLNYLKKNYPAIYKLEKERLMLYKFLKEGKCSGNIKLFYDCHVEMQKNVMETSGFSEYLLLYKKFNNYYEVLTGIPLKVTSNTQLFKVPLDEYHQRFNMIYSNFISKFFQAYFESVSKVRYTNKSYASLDVYGKIALMISGLKTCLNYDNCPNSCRVALYEDIDNIKKIFHFTQEHNLSLKDFLILAKLYLSNNFSFFTNYCGDVQFISSLDSLLKDCNITRDNVRRKCLKRWSKC